MDFPVGRLLCTGCAACQAACERNAIQMVPDGEGFSRPLISKDLCSGCGVCAKVCPVIKQDVSRRPLAVYAARAQEMDLRLRSSSGGVFSLLARYTLSREGVVYGVAVDETTGLVHHMAARSICELDKLCGSKYVQSNTGSIYHQVKEDLSRGREVLFSGTPCQIAALRHYLRTDYANLLLVDVICHGVPSPLAWEKYLVHRGTQCGKMVGISFRDKTAGWSMFSMSLQFESGHHYLSSLKHDTFLVAFLRELCSRLSCYHCSSRELRSGADVTLGDYWGVARFHSGLDDDKGTSLVLLNTEKGRQAWSRIASSCDYKVSTYENAISCNPALVMNSRPNRKRAKFFRLIGKMDFDSATNIAIRRSIFDKGLTMASKLLRRMGLRK